MGIFSCGIVGLSMWYFLCIRKAKIGQTLVDDTASQEIINTRLDKVVANFKKQIPMVSMFLSESKEESLKESVRREFYNLIPEFQQHLVPKMMKALWARTKLSILGMAFLLGFLLGLLQACLNLIDV